MEQSSFRGILFSIVFVIMMLGCTTVTAFAANDEVKVSDKVVSSGSIAYYKTDGNGTLEQGTRDAYHIMVDYTSPSEVKIKLKDAKLAGDIILPGPNDAFKTTITTERDSTIGDISYGPSSHAKLFFTGSGLLTTGSIYTGSNDDAATFEEGSNVVIGGYYSVTGDGGVDGVLIVKGNVTLNGGGITGTATVASTGTLVLNTHLTLCGKNGSDYSNTLLLETGGMIQAKSLDGTAIQVQLPLSCEREKESVINLPAGYLPPGYVLASGASAYYKIFSIAEEGKAITEESGSVLNGADHFILTQYATGISLDKETLSLERGKQDLLTAVVTPENAVNKAVIWSSSDEAVAKVDQNGTVTAVSVGQAVITAAVQDDARYKASCSVTVTEPEKNPEVPTEDPETPEEKPQTPTEDPQESETPELPTDHDQSPHTGNNFSSLLWLLCLMSSSAVLIGTFMRKKS